MSKSTMTLFEKMLTTVPGKHAYALGDLRYCHGHGLGERRCTELAAAEAYLESLAMAELRESLKREQLWVTELQRRDAKDDAPTAPGEGDDR